MQNIEREKQNIKAMKSLEIIAFSLAGVEGLEPSQAVLETDVLPLTLYPYVRMYLI